METNILSDAEITKLIDRACFLNGMGNLSAHINWQWSNGLKTTAGTANYITMRVKLSRFVFSKATREEQINTVIHEACHIIAYAKDKSCSPHGHVWQQCMMLAGENPTRCHNVDIGPRKRRSDSVSYTCSCPGKEHVLGRKRAMRHDTWRCFSCLTCKSFLQKK